MNLRAHGDQPFGGRGGGVGGAQYGVVDQDLLNRGDLGFHINPDGLIGSASQGRKAAPTRGVGLWIFRLNLMELRDVHGHGGEHIHGECRARAGRFGPKPELEGQIARCYTNTEGGVGFGGQRNASQSGSTSSSGFDRHGYLAAEPQHAPWRLTLGHTHFHVAIEQQVVRVGQVSKRTS